MASENIELICQAISISTVIARDRLHSDAEIFEKLDGLWSLQDYLSRLYGAVYDHPGEAYEVLTAQFTLLRHDIVNVLAKAAEGPLLRNAAANASCDSIRDLLVNLALLTQPSQWGRPSPFVVCPGLYPHTIS